MNGAALLEDLSATVARVATDVGAAVVAVGRDRRGSGVVIAPDRVLTNAHNLRAPQVTIAFPGGERHLGEVAGTDLDGDLAVVAVPTGDARPVGWDDAVPGLGTAVFALANPGGVRVSFGLVSSVGQAFRGPRGRRIADALEHTAPLGRGSSGGPLVGADGRLVGLNTHRRGEGLYLARPAATLHDRVMALSRGESVSRPRLGLAVAPPEVARRLRAAVGLPEREGLLVQGVEEGSPADAAGIQRGDLLVAAAGTPLRTSDDLFALLDATAPGGSLALELVRGSGDLEIEVVLPEERST